jgi:hypothetical protein
MGCCKFWLQLHGGAQGGQRRKWMPGQMQDHTQLVMAGRVMRTKLQGLSKAVGCSRPQPLLLQCDTQCGVCLRQLRIDRQRLVVAGHCLVQPALAFQRIAEIEPGLGHPRLQLHRQSAAGFSGLPLPLLRQHITQVAVRLGRSRVQPNCLSQTGHCLIELTACTQQAAEVGCHVGIARHQLQSALKRRLGILALDQQGHAPGLPRLAIARKALDQFGGQCLHHRRPAGAEVGHQQLQVGLWHAPVHEVMRRQAGTSAPQGVEPRVGNAA